MSKKSERRHHIERLKKKREKYLCIGGKTDKRKIGMIVDTPCICSCTMCGNPRKHFGEKTIQEKRVEQDYK